MIIKRNPLSECEQIVMKCVWDAGEDVTCAQIKEVLKEKYELDYKDTTVYTFLSNLKKKGFVDSQRRGVTYYWPIRDRDEYVGQIRKWYTDFWFHGSVAEHLRAYIYCHERSPEELHELKLVLTKIMKDKEPVKKDEN